MPYENRCRCLNCDEFTHHYHGARFANSFVSSRLCRYCGKSDGFYDSVEQWISTASDWKIWTWGDGYWRKVKP